MKFEIKDDLFKSVNDEWLKTAEIPSDRSSIGEFLELDIENEKAIARLAKKLLKQEQNGEIDDQILINFAQFYALTSDIDKREQEGTKPLAKYFEEIQQLKDFDDFKSKFIEFTYRDYVLPINFGVETDFLDSSVQSLYAGIAPHILPDKAHYDNPEIKAKFLKSFKSMAKKLLLPYVNDFKQANAIVKLALQYDELIARYSLTSLEKVRYTELYKPYKLDRIARLTHNLDIKDIVSKLVSKPVDKVVFSDHKFAQNLDRLLNERVFDRLKAWLSVQLLIKFSRYLDQKTRTAAQAYTLAVTGQSKVANKNKQALFLALDYFSIPVGTHYAKKVLSPRAKKNVETMVSHMIQIYKERLQKNTWLSQQTIDKAVLKLDTLGVHIGYPTEFKPHYKDLKVQGNSLIENVFRFNEVVVKQNLSQYKEPINKNLWSMSPDQVNAYYHPMYNHIVFPAGILNGAFYSIKHSSSENYGGIGAVIAHEISHAFDNNGANFDEKGNLRMWWTPEDFAEFGKRTQGMIDLFEGAETDNGKCSGTLTVSENIADAGGLSCALEAAKLEKDYDAKKFFINWARIWKTKYKPEIAKRLLESDPHAPTILRANIQAANREEFIEAFNIKETDKMFIPVEKRVKIW
ncbi:M13-type metalloendopeptidase [Mycoplasma simbae]|uniref:M13-type metalloendopeptidase n=1 Tax=Mycoplasma simbae TaxID=36744 RepID=UPI0004966369|nr:M13-type metalloendopeptidase [Mycoplasma simbae]